MPLHPAESRGYRELYLTGRQAVKRLGRLAEAFDGAPTRDLLDKAAESISRLLDELGPLTARHDLHGGVTAQEAERTWGRCAGPSSTASWSETRRFGSRSRTSST